MNKGNIIFLNGVSSSGKSTLASELVKQLPDYFHFSVDDFDTVIERMEDRENGRLIPIPTEAFFHQSIVMFSDRGINLIVDHVLHDEETTRDCLEVLKDYPVFFIEVYCPLNELERREQARGDRTIGQAKKQLDFIQQQEHFYDLIVDTYTNNPAVNAKKIKNIVEKQTATAWKITTKNYKKMFLSKKLNLFSNYRRD